MEGQISIFDVMYSKYKITKPIRLIEFFAGYGSQALALKYLGVEFEHWKICEWAVKSIQAYKDIHYGNDGYIKRNYEKHKDIMKKSLILNLYNLGVSSNYNEPMTKEQLGRLSYEQLDKIYQNIQITNNLVNIQTTHGADLEIVDTDKYDYILTYSFPCQDLSLAGKGKGMSDTSTRSGMLWEVERILTECKELGSLPQILLMENVPQVHGADNVKDFNKWQLRLEELGYKNYFQDLIATDYGIPQTRNRCFMVSILGDYSYTFPKPMPLKLKLKDMLEDNVDEKYYISDKMLQGMINTNFNSYKLESRLQDLNGAVDTLTTATGSRCPHAIPIKNATKKGYLEAKDGDGIDISSRMEHHRGNVQKDKIQTLTTQCDRGVVTACAMRGRNGEQQLELSNREIANTITTIQKDSMIANNLRIRKLTPKECFRLMGVKDEDFEKCAKNQSDSSLYHLAGDSIITTVLMAIFSQLLDIEWENKLWNTKNYIETENT